MSYIGTGGEDWVELDFDLFERQRDRDLQQWLVENRARLEEWLGTNYDIDVDEEDATFLTVDGDRRFRIEFGNDDRMVFTRIFSDEGLL